MRLDVTWWATLSNLIRAKQAEGAPIGNELGLLDLNARLTALEWEFRIKQAGNSPDDIEKAKGEPW